MADDEDLDDQPEIIRSPQEVARRALALFGVYGLAVETDRIELDAWLDENDLRRALSPHEAALFAAPMSARDRTNATWYSERLIMLLWALAEIDELPPPDEQCDTSVFLDLLPPFTDTDVSTFIANAKLRPDDVLLAMQDRTIELNWAARDSRINSRPPREPVDIEVIDERHHAINWVIGYGAQEWDDVTTDT